MHFVENWKQAWRWFSVQMYGVLMALPLVWAGLPDDAKAFMPEAAQPWVLTILAGVGIFGRLIDQNKDPAK